MNNISLADGPLQRAPYSIRGPHWLRTAGYVIAGLICLAIAPVTFVVLDHVIVVRWANKILDLISG